MVRLPRVDSRATNHSESLDSDSILQSTNNGQIRPKSKGESDAPKGSASERAKERALRTTHRDIDPKLGGRSHLTN